MANPQDPMAANEAQVTDATQSGQRQGNAWGARNAMAYTREEMEYALAGIGPQRRALNRGITRLADGIVTWLHHHWLATVNTILGVWIGIALLTPILYALGLVEPSTTIFHVYRFACDQLPTHSFFIAGYQVCLCARCLAIYSSMLLAGLSLAFLRNRHQLKGIGQQLMKGIGWKLWLLGMVPMALDGGTQFFGWRESNNLLRVLTGVIFGVATAWFTLPQIEAAAHDEGHPVQEA